MSSNEKTDLQREILLTWYNNPNATNKEISEACDCSASYVSTVKNRFDNYNEMEAMMDQQDKQMEQMFGDGIFDTSTQSGNQQGIVEQYEELPNNLAGHIMRGIILVVLAYAGFEILTTLV
ncbi:winged helix-turn-helix domain-containing protein [Halorubrum ezzemoulense]|uniref:Winged helix-turn-helix domain-containing protein n=1 Tax=Halorubrum ezzemoulense TaxID=337243 RepID=A0A256ISD6_HALEZ|nr:winged helix-turn-helix domain-containing protein [Halorubrum ezzemoulense]OYR59052.1 winged helix-turn-helix domain-containing protein [Halorubrum ezzemoulense]